MINVSKNAQKHFASLLLKEPVNTQIRVFIINPGTPNAECGVAYCLKNEVEESDVKFKYNQFYIYVNQSILPYLKNAEIDLIIDKIGSHLTLKTPYSKNNILKKRTSLEDKIEHFLISEINPQLAMHGGKVNLIKINTHGIAIIKFSGGCNGCAMIGSTLKGIVEKKLISNFTEIKKVLDETEHLHGNHSFY